MLATSSSLSACSTNTRERESNAEITSNDGFSVVAPISVIVPSSTYGSTASCCPLLKRWISSTNSTVRRPVFCSSRACATTLRKSATPALTAESATKWPPVAAATISASVVFPVPGGPQRIIEGTESLSIARRSARPGPTRCSCPTKSSRVLGRMRAASGALAGAPLRAVRGWGLSPKSDSVAATA